VVAFCVLYLLRVKNQERGSRGGSGMEKGDRNKVLSPKSVANRGGSGTVGEKTHLKKDAEKSRRQNDDHVNQKSRTGKRKGL